MKSQACLALGATFVLGAVVGNLTQSKWAPGSPGPSSSLSMKENGLFLWKSGILSKAGNRWHLRSTGERADQNTSEVIAFPWGSIATVTSRKAGEDGIIPFPRYPPDKYERDGHPYPVGVPANWFGAMCRDEKEFEDYTALMLTIKGQIGEDPPGQKPTFEGAGFYIVTAY